MVVVIVCLLNHYKVSTRSFINRPSQSRRQEDRMQQVRVVLGLCSVAQASGPGSESVAGCLWGPQSRTASHVNPPTKVQKYESSLLKVNILRKKHMRYKCSAQWIRTSWTHLCIQYPVNRDMTIPQEHTQAPLPGMPHRRSPLPDGCQHKWV